jgi:hypothetical protein
MIPDEIAYHAAVAKTLPSGKLSVPDGLAYSSTVGLSRGDVHICAPSGSRRRHHLGGVVRHLSPVGTANLEPPPIWDQCVAQPGSRHRHWSHLRTTALCPVREPPPPLEPSQSCHPVFCRICETLCPAPSAPQSTSWLQERLYQDPSSIMPGFRYKPECSSDFVWICVGGSHR